MNTLYFRKNLTSPSNIIKVGSTTSLYKRDCQYSTGEYERGIYIGAIQILNCKDNNYLLYIEKLCQNFCKNLHVKNNGGIEFYKEEVIKIIPEFLSSTNIQFKIISKEEIENIIKQEKQTELINFLNKSNFYKLCKNYLRKLKTKLKLNIQPKGQHQTELYNNLDKFKEEKIGQLIWCCGLGKTFMSLMICYKLGCKKMLICVPSKYLLKQFKKSIEDAFGITNPICIFDESDNKKDIYKINNNNDIIIVLSTYHSCKKVLDVANDDFVFDIKIGDEAHHLVTSKKDEDKFTFDKFHKIKSEYTLFMTATQKEIINNNNDTYTMSNKEQFGSIISNKNIDWAIKNKCITNYNIVCIMNSDDEIDHIFESIDFNLICKNDIECNKKELFFAAYNALKCINEGLVTHLLVYTNRQDTADIVYKIINILIDKNIFENINKDILYNKSLHSNSNINLNNEVDKFKNKTFGIISCVYIFGEGFDLPKLNGVVIGEKMTADIRIVQSCLRPNRLEKGNPNKKAYIVIPTNINKIDDKIKLVLTEMIKENENIIQKIKFVKTKKGKKILKKLIDKKIKMNNCKETLARLKLNLYNNGCFGRTISIENEYKYNKDLIKRMKFNSVKEYLDKDFPDKIKNPDSHFYKIWKNWFDYLSIDTSEWIKDKYEFIRYCKDNNIKSTTDYYNYICNHKCLPPEPEYFYNNFSNLNDELGYRKYIYVKR
jgi:predicted helicase